MSYIEDFLHRLNLIPPQADRLLRNIRQIDRQVEQLRLNLQPLRDDFLFKLQRWNDKRTNKTRQQIEEHYKHIVQLETEIDTKSKQKINIAQKLYNLIHQPTQKLDKELHQRGLDKGDDDFLRKKRGKKPLRKGMKRSEWEYDPNEPRYCYCGRPSYGEMVMCENTYCDREWFHVECLGEKKLPEKWFCRNCRAPQPPSFKKGFRPR